MKILIPIYIILFFVGLQHFFEWQSAGFILGLAALSFTTAFDKTRKGSRRYFYISCFFFVLFLLIPVNTFYYLSLITAIAFCLEMYMGKMTLLPMFVLICMSPIFDFWMNMFTFPIRLQLTAVAGSMLQIAGIPTSVQGNVIITNGQEFSVDPACMGLQMTVTAMLCGLIVIGGLQKKYERHLSFVHTITLLVIVFFLNALANLLRIVCLVHFSIMPDTNMHGIIGVLSLMMYVLLPFIYICRFTIHRFGQAVIKKKRIYRIVPTGPLLFRNGILLVCMIYGCTLNLRPRSIKQHALPVAIKGYELKNLPGDVTQLYNKHALVYLKYIPGFYTSEHHPMICWKGSGYTFEKVQEQQWDGKSVYTATLLNGTSKLYTAWWYDNGQHGTISQFEWRYDVFAGAAPYSLVNVTTETEAALKQEVMRLRG